MTDFYFNKSDAQGRECVLSVIYGYVVNLK